ncbi:hypothetical protein DRJ25_02290 [Candidatus Woesearchaeota archaeon]|nr:MAG: hypothetical protein DRJ25_02290 [Candidatus Woesearchaeota archaeon]
MSLFICPICQCIENTNLMTKGLNRDDAEFPNLTRMEMDGWNKDTDEWDEPMYLCAGCNTGTPHGEFELRKATEEEKELASYSSKGFITPSNHPEGCITGGYNNYHVDERYKLFIEIFGKDVSKDNNLLFKIYIEDRMNFNRKCLTDLLDVKNEYGSLTGDDIKYAMTNSQVYKELSSINSPTYRKEVFGYGKKKSASVLMSGLIAMAGMDIDDYIPESSTKTPHWKEVQNVDEKNTALKKAGLKRDMKLLKKQKPVNKSLLTQLQSEYKEL